MTSSNSWEYLAPAFNEYLPEKHRKLFDLNESTLSKKPWTSEMEYYGNSVELMANIEDFMAFPGSTSYLKMDLTLPPTTNGIVHKGSKGNEYCLKHDLLAAIQGFVNRLAIPLENESAVDFVRAMSGFYLNTQEYKLRKEWELVQFPRGEIMNFGHLLNEKVKNIPRTHMLLTLDSIDTVFEKLRQILPVHPEDTEHNSIHKRLLKLNEVIPFERNLEMYETLLDWTHVILKEIDQFVGRHPDFFLPRSGNQTPRVPVVRVFEEEDHRFVLFRELKTEMERSGMDTSYVRRIESKLSAHGTLEFYPLPDLIGDQFGKIEFVGYKVRRTKHRAVFIPSFDGKYCISTGDLILETMRDITSVSGYYRQLTKRMGDILQNLFEQFESMIFAITKGTRFVGVEDAKELKRQFMINVGIEMRRFPPIEPFSIRQINTNKLPFEIVMNEVKRLGIWKTSSSEYVRRTCEIICKRLTDSKPSGSKFTTADLHEVIEGIQMCCSIINYAKIFKLLHNSGHCRLIPQVCYYCCEDSYLTKMMPERNNMMRRFGINYFKLGQQQTAYLMEQAREEAVSVMAKWMDKVPKTRKEEAKVEPLKPVSKTISKEAAEKKASSSDSNVADLTKKMGSTSTKD